MKELKFLITYIDAETRVERIDYDYSLERMIAHYDSVGFNAIEIKKI